MSRFKTWPRLAIVAAVFGLLGWGAAALWLRNEPKAEALGVPRAARVERVDGEVGLYRGLTAGQANEQADAQWVELTPNTPVTEGDRIYARDDSTASVAFTGRNFARLDPETSLDVLSLSDERTQLALRDGSAVFNLGALRPGELYEVATPRGAFELREPGFYEVGLNDDGSAWVSVLSGLAQVVGLAGSGEIGKGEMLTLLGQTAADIALSRLSPDYAGGLLDDYYGYQYPDVYDGRYRDYDAYLGDPGYYDPYNRYESYRHVSDYVPGVYDLDRYGQWQDVSGYGSLWRPNVDAGWAPYRDGYWAVDDPYGLTWISNEPWGYAPYHYGRWANVNSQWYWVPEGANTRPAYSPALVAFMPRDAANQIAWVPLAPGDPYATPYYDENWQPHYYGDPYAAPQQVVNFGVPGALSVVPAEYFGHYVDDDLLVAADPRSFGETRPVLDPFSVALMRQAALATTNARRRVDIPPGLAKKLDDTYVYTSARPFAPPFLEGRQRGRARTEVVGEKQKKQKLQFKDERRADLARHPDELRTPGGGRARGLMRADEARQRQSERAAFESNPGRGKQFEANSGRGRQLESSAARGRQEERRLARELERQNRAARDNTRDQQRAAREQQRAAAMRAEQQNALRRAGRQRAQGERVSMRQHQPKHAQRQQVHAAPQRQQRHNAAPPRASRPQREAQRPQPQFNRQEVRQQQKAERRQGGPPAHAGGGHGQPKAQQPGKGKGKGRP